MNNTSKPTTSLTDTTRVSFAELWSTITTTWATETRTWLAMGSLFSNVSKSGFPLWSVYTFPWTLILPWQTDGASFSNTSRPS